MASSDKNRVEINLVRVTGTARLDILAAVLPGAPPGGVCHHTVHGGGIKVEDCH
jgi:hypothetical protein